MYSYMTKNNILYESQHGFRQGHSTESLLIEFVDSVKHEVDQGHVPLGIFIDLSKAFDTLDHEILIKKLEFYGFNRYALKWFKSYFFNRKQFTMVNKESSKLEIIKTGVPQGSVLGPLLFLIYINDLKNCSNLLKFKMFADDTTILLSICYNKKSVNIAIIKGNIMYNK